MERTNNMPKGIKKITPTDEVEVITLTNDKKIVAQENQSVNFDPANQVEFAQKAAKALMVVIDATKPLVMQGKRYLYFEHWQTIARFFNTTVGIESTTKDQNGYIAKAVVYNKDGIIIGGAEASCMNDERNWTGKPDFQLRSMAQTRAMAKALRSMYGFVAVLAGVEATPAEEMNGVDMGHQTVTNSYPPTDKQYEFIKNLMEQKRVDEAWVIEQGFSLLKDLTGGRTGTATQLIELLKNYIPTESITIQDSSYLDNLPSSRLSLIAEELKMRLEIAKSKDELDTVALDIDFKKNELTKLEIGKLRMSYKLSLEKIIGNNEKN